MKQLDKILASAFLVLATSWVFPPAARAASAPEVAASAPDTAAGTASAADTAAGAAPEVAPAAAATTPESSPGAAAVPETDVAVAAPPQVKDAKPAPMKWETDPALVEKWGVEVVSIRRTANGHMIDFRYKVLDAEKAASLFKRQTKPRLIHGRTGKVLAVPETAKVGPLRNSNIPKQGRIYWMFFGNAGGLVRAGDKVTVAIGDFRAEDLIVE